MSDTRHQPRINNSVRLAPAKSGDEAETCRSAPSPLRGEGWGEGAQACRICSGPDFILGLRTPSSLPSPHWGEGTDAGHAASLMVSLSNHGSQTASFDKLRMRNGVRMRLRQAQSLPPVKTGVRAGEENVTLPPPQPPRIAAHPDSPIPAPRRND